MFPWAGIRPPQTPAPCTPPAVGHRDSADGGETFRAFVERAPPETAVFGVGAVTRPGSSGVGAKGEASAPVCKYRPTRHLRTQVRAPIPRGASCGARSSRAEVEDVQGHPTVGQRAVVSRVEMGES
jgi:hypothetical protein